MSVSTGQGPESLEPRDADQKRCSVWRPVEQWPEIDRQRWTDGTRQAAPYEVPEYGQALRPASLDSYAQAYGRWLSYLDELGLLDPASPPESRVTPQRVGDYLRSLEKLGLCGQSRLLALSGLRCTLRIIAPGQDWLWIVRPQGVPILGRLRSTSRPVYVPEAESLFRWGMTIAARAGETATNPRALAARRDGLLIAFLAARPLRVRTLAALNLGQHVILTQTGWWLTVGPEDTKNRKSVDVPLPDALGPLLADYVDRVRPLLLQHSNCEAFWVSREGRRYDVVAISSMIRQRSRRDFPKEFGPHRFRHAAATSAATLDPHHPGLGAAMLGSGARMVRESYDRSGEAIAAQRLHSALATERERLRLFAQEFFDKGGH